MFFKVTIFIFAVAIFFISGCSQSEDLHYSRSEIAMNTVITLKATGRNSKIAIDESFEKIAQFEKNIYSDLKKIELSAGNGKFVEVSPDVYKMLEIALKYSELTDGAFDVTCGSEIALWKFDSENPKVPTIEEIENARKFVGFKHLQLQESNSGVKLDLSGVKINLGGIAKGYAVDLVREIFLQYGIEDGLIDFGSSTIFALGEKNIGLRNPQKLDSVVRTVKMKDSVLSTSGDYMQYVVFKGKRYHHILNPKTGMPVDNGISAVSVVIDGKFEHCSAIADILSTAIFVLGMENQNTESLLAKFELSDFKVTAVFTISRNPLSVQVLAD